MTCITTRMEALTPPLTTICGVLLFVASAVAAVVNSLVLAVIVRMNNKRSRSTVILSSLAVSDLMVGTVLGPITAWQQISSASLHNCTLDMVRAYFVILLVGSSVLTLAIVSYDRYLLLTKHQQYEKHMTRLRASTLIALAWGVSALIPILRFVNKKAYLIMIFVLFVAPLFILAVCYIMIMRAVKHKERHLRKVGASSASVDMSSQVTSEATSATEGGTTSVHKTRKHIRLARTVVILIVCYIVCILPLNTWIGIQLFIGTRRSYVYQVFYIMTMMMTQMNSCINPLVYFSRNPDFSRGFKRLFNVKRRRKIHTSDSANIPKMRSNTGLELSEIQLD